jgi:hypothetical protein
MTKLRALTARGIEEFRAFLQQIRDGAEFRANPAILYVDEFTRRLPRTVEIKPRTFANKLDAAEYLAPLVADLPGLDDDVGLWSWLALFYFDQLSPLDAADRRRPREDYHYIPSQSGWHKDRHLLAGPCKLFLQHGRNARLLLHPPVHQHGAFIYNLGFRRDLIANRGLIAAIDALYWDPRRNAPKRGATTSSRPGSLQRLIDVIQQLDFNYDLQGMRVDEIVQLLPPEFDPWRASKMPVATAAAPPLHSPALVLSDD